MNRLSFLSILIIILVFASSCSRRVRYIYKENQQIDSVYSYPVKSKKYKLKPDDILQIKIITTEPDINKLFQIDEQNNNTNQNLNGGSFYLSGFTVNDTGFVQIPVIGTLKAAGKTVSEFRNEVTSKTHEYLKDAVVNVKFVNFKISFLGEVNNKGPIYIYQDNIDILEAVSRAGGITDYANMKDITVVRKEKNKRIVYKLDLSKRELLTSEKFYLYPDDIIIVEPINAKIAKINIKDYIFFISALSSAISTTVLILNIFAKTP